MESSMEIGNLILFTVGISNSRASCSSLKSKHQGDLLSFKKIHDFKEIILMLSVDRKGPKV